MLLLSTMKPPRQLTNLFKNTTYSPKQYHAIVAVSKIHNMDAFLLSTQHIIIIFGMNYFVVVYFSRGCMLYALVCVLTAKAT